MANDASTRVFEMYCPSCGRFLSETSAPYGWVRARCPDCRAWRRVEIDEPPTVPEAVTIRVVPAAVALSATAIRERRA